MAAPLGNQNGAKGKRWEAAILRALEAWPDKPDATGCNALMRGINEAAHGFVAKMMADRDIGFYREFGDRLDGKAPQAITGDGGGALVININATQHDESL